MANLLSPDRTIDSPQLRVLLLLLGIVLIACGGALLVFGRRLEGSKLARAAVGAFLGAFAWIAIPLALTFSLFLALELLPGLRERLPSSGIRYYDQRKRYVPDDELVFRRRPGHDSSDYYGDLYSPAYGLTVPTYHYTETYDENGFRNPHGRVSSDVVILGDSYMAHGVDESDTFSERLASESGLRTMNFGVGHYGPPQYLAAFRRYGLPQRPRAAILAFFEGNDVQDTLEYLQWRHGGRYYRFSLAEGLLRRYVAVLRDIAALARWKSPALLVPLRPEGGVHPDLAELDLGGKRIFARFQWQSEERPVDELLRTPGWQEVGRVLAEFVRTARANGIRPMLVFVPTKAHIYAPYTTPSSGSNWLRIRDREIANRDHTEQALSRLCEEIGLEFYSLAAPFDEAAARGVLLYYPFDTHWNSAGRQLAAEVLTPILLADLQQDREAGAEASRTRQSE